MCLYNRLVENPKYKPNKKNGGIVPPISDKRIRWVPLSCGECIECRRKKAREWQVRLMEDVKQNKNGKMITLTFSNEKLKDIADDVLNWQLIKGKFVNEPRDLKGYDLDNAICKRAVYMFCERWRKHHKKTLRHWLVTELGHNGTENIHIHGIVWADSVNEVELRWQNGWVYKGDIVNIGGQYKLMNYVNARTVNYIVKYITKRDLQHKTYKPLILTSNGIGANYINTEAAKRNIYTDTTREYYKTATGHKIALPIYLRNKIYTDAQREKLWIEKIDKQERYVCGEKINIKHGDEAYIAIRQFYRMQNAKLGYGTGYHSEEAKEYEKNRRILMQETRRAKTNTGI